MLLLFAVATIAMSGNDMCRRLRESVKLNGTALHKSLILISRKAIVGLTVIIRRVVNQESREALPQAGKEGQ